MNKPDIPKRLSARIRAAQERVRDKRLCISSAQHRLSQDKKRVAEFEADPEAFAKRYYGNNPADSYPVETNILRCRGGIEYRTRRISEYHTALKHELTALAMVEAGVMAEVKAMRPSTGRVPWPVLESSAEQQRDFDAELLRIEGIIAQEDIERARLEAEEQSQMEERHRQEDEEALQEERVRRAVLTPEERAKEDYEVLRLNNALDSGELSVIELIEKLRAQKRG